MTIEVHTAEDLADFIAATVACAEHGEPALVLVDGREEVTRAVTERNMPRIFRATRRAAQEMMATMNVAWSISLLKWRYN
jgi:hypothetical protein